MSNANYNYDPAKIAEFGKDRMRFELGDTMVEGGSDTSALSDEEINAAIRAHPTSWKRAKLMLLESICHRFAYEVDTKTGPLSLSLNDRAKLWREDYATLKKEVMTECCKVPRFGKQSGGKPPYFYSGMQQNERARS